MQPRFLHLLFIQQNPCHPTFFNLDNGQAPFLPLELIANDGQASQQAHNQPGERLIVIRRFSLEADVFANLAVQRTADKKTPILSNTADIGYVIVGLLVGGMAGSIMAKRVEMTKMPELVAFMHSMIGMAAVFIAIAAVVEPQSLGIVKQLGDAIPAGNRLELFLGAAIGAITFSVR